MDKIDLIKTTNTYQKILEDYKKNQVSHCYLLLTPDKMSRELFAKSFASLVVCGDDDNNIIERINKEIHPDVFFLPKSNTLKVEDIEFVLDRLNYFPMEADCKVFVLQDFSSATMQAQNKLLKTLEETPNNVFFLLCSEKEDGILPTIKSRCQILELEPLSESVLNIILAEHQVDAKTMEIAKFYGRGEMGRIEEALQNQNIVDMVNLAFDILENCKASKDILQYVIKVDKFRNNIIKFVQIYADILEETLRMMYLGKTTYKILNFDTILKQFNAKSILLLQTSMIKILEMIDRHCNTTMIMDEILIQTCKCKNM